MGVCTAWKATRGSWSGNSRPVGRSPQPPLSRTASFISDRPTTSFTLSLHRVGRGFRTTQACAQTRLRASRLACKHGFEDRRIKKETAESIPGTHGASRLLSEFIHKLFGRHPEPEPGPEAP